MKNDTKAMLAVLAMAVSMPLAGFAENTTTPQGTDTDAVMEVGRVYTPQPETKQPETVPTATVTVTPAPVVTVQSVPAPTAAPVVSATTDTPVPVQQVTVVPGAADWLEPAVGDWYDTNGQFMMTVTTSAINSCPVTALTDMTMDYPRTGRFTVAEADGEKTIKLDLLGHGSHQYLIVNDRTPLRRSLHADHYETLGNLYLGMTKDDVVAAYGQPVSVTPDQGGERWSYTTPHVDVVLQGNLVMTIRAYSDSNVTFAQSGLSPVSTPDAYAQAYGLTAVPTIPAEPGVSSTAYTLPQGERLHFGQGFVELSVF